LSIFEIPYFSKHGIEYVDVIPTDVTEVISSLLSICPYYTIAEMNVSCSSGTRIAAEGLRTVVPMIIYFSINCCRFVLLCEGNFEVLRGLR
jgi:hypothetical protein